MKQTLLFVSFLFLLFAGCDSPREVEESPLHDMHNSMNSLDWAGTYTGEVPCASCQGIKTTIQVNSDLTYSIEKVYVGKSDSTFSSEGTFSWSDDGSTITLENIQEVEAANQYLVGENMLIQLDLDGNRITGNLSDQYILEKSTAGISGTRWILKEIYGNEIDSDRSFREIPHLIIADQDSHFSGNGGCNSFSGTYERAENGRISFNKLVSTKIACNHIEVENELFNILQTVDSYTISGDTLILNRARMAPLALFVAQSS